MSETSNNHAYSLVLASGSAWEIGACEGADAGVCAWVDEFAAYLGLERGVGDSARCILFGRVLGDSGRFGDTYASFVPPLNGAFPSHGWQVWGRAGAVLIRNPAVTEILCGLYEARAPIADQMRYALSPVIEGAMAQGGLPIHGALVERQGIGVILSGKSGAGKTTCCRRLPHPWRVLGDDLALVVRDTAGKIAAHPLPTWSAVKSGEIRWCCHVNQAVPLRALFILEQATQDRIEPLAGAKSAVMIAAAGRQALAPLNHLPIRQASTVRKYIFDNAVTLAAAIPAYRLHVRLEGCFWEKIEEVIEKAECEVPGVRILREGHWENPAAVAGGISGNGRIV